MIIPDQMDTVDNQEQWRFPNTPSVHGHLLQFVESPFDVQKWSSIPRTSNAEQTTNVAGKNHVFQYSCLEFNQNGISLLLVEFKVQCLPQSNAEDFEVRVSFEQGNALAIDLAHRLQNH